MPETFFLYTDSNGETLSLTYAQAADRLAAGTLTVYEGCTAECPACKAGN